MSSKQRPVLTNVKKTYAGDELIKGGERGEMRLIVRAAAILRTLAERGDGLSLGQLATYTGLARATVQRIVAALETEGFVTTSPLIPGVRLGAELVRIAGSVHRDVVGLCRPYITALRDKVEETVELTMLKDGAAVVLEQMQALHMLRIVNHVGTRLPLHCTASGKAHLSQMPEEECQRVLLQPLVARTNLSLTCVEDIIEATRCVETDDVFRDCQEYAEGIYALAVPIRGLNTGNYALSIMLPGQRYDSRTEPLERALLQCRDQIERAAGMK